MDYRPLSKLKNGIKKEKCYGHTQVCVKVFLTEVPGFNPQYHQKLIFKKVLFSYRLHVLYHRAEGQLFTEFLVVLLN